MKASDIIITPAVVRDSETVEHALRVMVNAGLPGVIVVDERDHPLYVIPATQALRLAVPDEFQRDPALVRAIDELHADTFSHEEHRLPLSACSIDEKLASGTVTLDATMLEIATVMARLRSPLLAVVDKDDRLLGAVTLADVVKRLVARAGG